MIKTTTNKFRNANYAFEYFYQMIDMHGMEFDTTKALFNVGFQLDKPNERSIDSHLRNWNEDYAIAEWEWYLSGSPRIETLGEIYGKIPPIWERMADENGEVNSNYGSQWERGYQLDKVVAQLKNNPNTRQAAISIYDGKEISRYKNDTPCTYAVQFTILNNKLNMCVTMRSNDLWFGFCNDQYCFSQLQELVAERTGYELGSYFHFAHNLHLYENKLGLWSKPNNIAQRKADYYG
jgi:thymidylate synthase